MHLTHILDRLPSTFAMIDLMRAIFGEFISDVGKSASESWNAQTAQRLATVLRKLNCEQLPDDDAIDDVRHPTTNSVWQKPPSWASA